MKIFYSYFLSYSWSDGYDKATALHRELERQGHPVWHDETDANHQQSLVQIIPEQISATNYFEAIVTDDYNEKVQHPGWIQSEVTYALSQCKIIFIVDSTTNVNPLSDILKFAGGQRQRIKWESVTLVVEDFNLG